MDIEILATKFYDYSGFIRGYSKATIQRYRRHGPERLQEDMEREAILTRLGWRFIRIRGSVFFRDSDRAMATVFSRLSELGITPDRAIEVTPVADNSELVDRVRCRAEELQEVWKVQTEGVS